MAVEDGADGPPFDAEAITQFVYGRSGLVTGDEFLDLVGVELSGSTGFGPVSGRWSGRGGVGQLPEQGPGLLPGVLCCSKFPKVHHCL